MDIKCSHFNPVTVEGSLRTDSNGGLVKEQRCDLCGAIRSGARVMRRVRSPGRSAWEPWAFDDWGPAMPNPTNPDHWATGLVEESRRAGRQPVRGAYTSAILENRELALSYVKTLIAIHGFRPADLVPNSDDVKTS